MRTFMMNERGPSRYVSARLNKLEDHLLSTMAKREGMTASEFIRSMIIREATRPLFGKPLLSSDEVQVDGDLRVASHE